MKQDSVAFQNPASFTRSKFTTKVTRNAKFFEYLSDAPERCNRKSRFLWSYNLTPGLQTGHFHLFLFFFYRNYCLWTKALCPTSLRHKTAGQHVLVSLIQLWCSLSKRNRAGPFDEDHKIQANRAKRLMSACVEHCNLNTKYPPLCSTFRWRERT